MVSEQSCGELLTRLGDAGAVIKTLKRDLPHIRPPSGLLVLTTLRHRGDLRISELAELLDIDQSVASRQVADLEERGWIRRTPNPHDGRSWYVGVSPDGERVADEGFARLRHLLTKALADWTDEEIAMLCGLLARLHTSFGAWRAGTAALPRTSQK